MNRRNLLRATGSMITLGTLGATSAAADPPDGRGHNRDDHPGRGPGAGDIARGEQDRDVFVDNGMTIEFDGCNTIHVTGHNNDAQDVYIEFTYGVRPNFNSFSIAPPGRDTFDMPEITGTDEIMVTYVWVTDGGGTDPFDPDSTILVEGGRDRDHPCSTITTL